MAGDINEVAQEGLQAGVQNLAQSLPERLLNMGMGLLTSLLMPVALIAAPFLFTGPGEQFLRGLLGENSELADTIFGFRDQLVAGADTTSWLSWLSPVFEFLGIDVDGIVNEQIDAQLTESFGNNPQLLAALRPIGRALAEAGFQNVNLHPQNDEQRNASEEALANSLFTLMSNPNVTDAQLNTVLQALTSEQGANTVDSTLVTDAITRLLQDATRRDTLLNQRGALLQQIVEQYTGEAVSLDQIRAIASSGIDFTAAMNMVQRVRNEGLDTFIASIASDTPAAATDRRTLLSLLQSADPAILPETMRSQAGKLTSLLTAIDSDPAVRSAVQQLASGNHIQTVLSYAQGETSMLDLVGQLGFSNLAALNTVRVAMGEQAIPEQPSAAAAAATPAAPAPAASAAATLPETHPGVAAAVAEMSLSPSISGGEEGSPAANLTAMAQGLGASAQALGSGFSNTFGRMLGG